MKYDLVIGGVGGQGILSIAYVIDNSALKQGLHFKQAEVHGMAQRGGAVSSHLRMSDRPIHSDTVPLAGADLLLSMEPMELLRYLPHLSPDGSIVTSVSPVENIPDYPALPSLVDALAALPRGVLVNGTEVARECGSHRAANMVVLGAAAPFVPIPAEVMEGFIEQLFARKGEKLVQTNIRAFRAGLAHGNFYRAMVARGAAPHRVLRLALHLASETVTAQAAPAFARLLASERWPELDAWFTENPKQRLPADEATAAMLLEKGSAGASG